MVQGVPAQRIEGSVAERHAGGQHGVAMCDSVQGVGGDGFAPLGGAALQVAWQDGEAPRAQFGQQGVDDPDDEDGASGCDSQQVDDGLRPRAGALDRRPGGYGHGVRTVRPAVGQDVHQVGVQRRDPYRQQRMGEEAGHVRTGAVVDRPGRDRAGFDGARADGPAEAEAEHLVAVPAAPPVVPYGLGRREGHGDPAGTGIRTQFPGQCAVHEHVEGEGVGPGGRGRRHARTSRGRRPASSDSTRSRAPSPTVSPAMTCPR